MINSEKIVKAHKDDYKMKNELLKKYAQTKDDLIFLANILDKNDTCRDWGCITSTGFLDLRQQGMIVNMEREFSEKHMLFGGFLDAERKMLMFFPDYLDKNPVKCMCVLSVKHSAYQKLSHRDFLGSLMSLGITRENTGDILVSDNGAQIVIKNEMAQFLITNYNKVADTKLECEIIPISEIIIPKDDAKEIMGTIASLRLDAVCALAFSITRGNAVQLIESKKVYINDLPADKCDRQIYEGDKIRIV